MDVSEWKNTPRYVVSQPPTARALWSPPLIGVFGTLLMHAIIAQLFYGIGNAQQALQSESQRHKASDDQSKDSSTVSLVLVDQPPSKDVSKRIAEELFRQISADTKRAIVVVLPDLPVMNVGDLVLGKDEQEQSVENQEQGDEDARLFGVYTGQIHARIERIWRRPRSPISDQSTRLPWNHFSVKSRSCKI